MYMHVHASPCCEKLFTNFSCMRRHEQTFNSSCMVGTRFRTWSIDTQGKTVSATVMMVAHRATMVCPPCTGVALGCPERPTGALWSEASRGLGLPERPTHPSARCSSPETPPHARGISSDVPGSSARVVPPPGIVSTVALRSGWGVGADRHRGPP